jgi:birA, biotin-[acetyl-CoA-carboxylase] ligase region
MHVPPTEVIEVTTSTNTLLARRFLAGEAGPYTSIRARFQTEGRGRFGRSWTAKPDSALLYSAIITTPSAPTRIPLAAGVAVIKVLDHPQLALKWPNDVLLEDQKLAGILTQHLGEKNGLHYLVLGIGINLTDAPEGKAKLDRDPDQLANSISKLLPQIDNLFEEYPHYFRQGTVTARTPSGETISGYAMGVDELGSLQIRSSKGITSVSAAEVTFEEKN